MEVLERVINSANNFYHDIDQDLNARYRSWEHCYYSFYKARSDLDKDYDYLSLQLAFYLASWGMYRGSSFLLQKDYRIHIPVVKELLKSKYDILFAVECEQFANEEVIERLDEIGQYLSSYYGIVRASVKKTDIKSDISEILITKILLGTLGCVPAYDRFFNSGIKKTKVAVGQYNKKSIQQLARFYIENKDELENVRKSMRVEEDILYPQMKLLDMGFWEIGASYEN